MASRIYTVGSNTRTAAEFLKTLAAVGVRAVVDVRPVPGERLVRALHAGGPGGIPARGGHHLHLAGRRSGRLRSEGYEVYCRTPSFARGLRRLEALGAGSPTAILCAERLPWRCHRRFIATALRGRGWEVVHILEPDRTWAPAEGQEG